MARVLSVVFVTISVLQAAWGSVLPVADECTSSLGIIGGKNASISELPSAVSVLIGKNGYRVCGGSIIHERFILTSALCVTTVKNDPINVRFGSSYLNSGGDLDRVVKIIPHKNYQLENMTNDIALLKLENAITFGWLAKAQLPEKDFEVKEGTQANFTGWGGANVGDSKSDLLQEVTLPIKPRKCCRDLSSRELNDASRICAGTPSAKPYLGDGGSPLTQNGVLVGVESYASGSDNLFVFTNVASYRDWIDTEISEYL